MQMKKPAAAPEEREEIKAWNRKKKLAAIRREILSWLSAFAFAVVFLFLLQTFVAMPMRVEGFSMSDTLMDNEMMLVTKPEYWMGNPSFGDVVICKYPGRTEDFIKRVMGLPGDEIEIRSNVVFRNGEPVPEPYLTSIRNDDGFSMAPYKLGEDEYFVMGDNRDNSHDCRNMNGEDSPQAITRDMIVGHVRCVFFPFDKIRVIH